MTWPFGHRYAAARLSPCAHAFWVHSIIPPHSAHGSVRSSTFGSGLMFRVYGRTRASGVLMGVFGTQRTPAFCVSLACHLMCFAALVLLMRQGARAPTSTTAETDRSM